MTDTALPADIPMPRDGRVLPVSERVLVMGILNVTPDSFSDGGRYVDPDAAVERALAMVADGADVIDVGGESSRPGSDPVPADEQIRRVVPVIRALRDRSDVPVAVDTRLAPVAEAGLDAGADIINDISALRDDDRTAALAAERKAPVALMHMLGTPRTMQKNPAYDDVVSEVRTFLEERRDAALAAGVAPEAIILDPGIGFGKTVEHNLVLMARLDSIAALGHAVLFGASRKSTIGAVLDLPVEERLEGTLATGVLAAASGARILRVHDVRETVRATRMAEAILRRR